MAVERLAPGASVQAQIGLCHRYLMDLTRIALVHRPPAPTWPDDATTSRLVATIDLTRIDTKIFVTFARNKWPNADFHAQPRGGYGRSFWVWDVPTRHLIDAFLTVRTHSLKWEPEMLRW